LTGKTSGLRAHVGHKVRVKGRTTGGTDNAKNPGSMSGAEGGEQTLRVTSIQHLSNTCNMQGGSSAR
jgi:hypothetical protein